MSEEFWFGTGNSGKLKEYELLLKDLKIALHHQGEIAGFTPRPEDGKTFLDNARIKAKTLRSVKNTCFVFGEDAGLEVEGLAGLPGIHSARYAGPQARDSENTAKLLKMMAIRPIANRNARFYCSLVVYTSTGEEWIFDGALTGSIAPKPAGIHGFGYDSVFLPTGQTQTLAELGPGFKLQNSHRSIAFRKFLERYRQT